VRSGGQGWSDVVCWARWRHQGTVHSAWMAAQRRVAACFPHKLLLLSLRLGLQPLHACVALLRCCVQLQVASGETGPILWNFGARLGLLWAGRCGLAAVGWLAGWAAAAA
jgi:hypothetical protein